MLGVVIINIIIIVSALILEKFVIKNNTVSHSIIYEDLELLKSAKKQKLLKEISMITGKDILNIKIRKIDYKNKEALLDISYNE